MSKPLDQQLLENDEICMNYEKLTFSCRVSALKWGIQTLICSVLFPRQALLTKAHNRTARRVVANTKQLNNVFQH